jgi:hypothetical protein
VHQSKLSFNSLLKRFVRIENIEYLYISYINQTRANVKTEFTTKASPKAIASANPADAIVAGAYYCS